jgi:hypothetical protein
VSTSLSWRRPVAVRTTFAAASAALTVVSAGISPEDDRPAMLTLKSAA